VAKVKAHLRTQAGYNVTTWNPIEYEGENQNIISGVTKMFVGPIYLLIRPDCGGTFYVHSELEKQLLSTTQPKQVEIWAVSNTTGIIRKIERPTAGF